MAVDVKLIKQLRDKTSAGVADVRLALEEAGNDIKKAEQILKEKGIASASKKSDRETNSGLVESYVHQGRVGAIVEVLCETDFVARTDEFKSLTHEIAMQVASMNPKDEKALLAQEYIRDPQITVADLVKQTIATLGENITVGRITRIELGK